MRNLIGRTRNRRQRRFGRNEKTGSLFLEKLEQLPADQVEFVLPLLFVCMDRRAAGIVDMLQKKSGSGYVGSPIRNGLFHQKSTQCVQRPSITVSGRFRFANRTTIAGSVSYGLRLPHNLFFKAL